MRRKVARSIQFQFVPAHLSAQDASAHNRYGQQAHYQRSSKVSQFRCMFMFMKTLKFVNFAQRKESAKERERHHGKIEYFHDFFHTVREPLRASTDAIFI